MFLEERNRIIECWFYFLTKTYVIEKRQRTEFAIFQRSVFKRTYNLDI